MAQLTAYDFRAWMALILVVVHPKKGAPDVRAQALKVHGRRAGYTHSGKRVKAVAGARIPEGFRDEDSCFRKLINVGLVLDDDAELGRQLLRDYAHACWRVLHALRPALVPAPPGAWLKSETIETKAGQVTFYGPADDALHGLERPPLRHRKDIDD